MALLSPSYSRVVTLPVLVAATQAISANPASIEQTASALNQFPAPPDNSGNIGADIQATENIYIGLDNTVTPLTGFLIPAGMVYPYRCRLNFWFCGATGAGVSSSSSSGGPETLGTVSILWLWNA